MGMESGRTFKRDQSIRFPGTEWSVYKSIDASRNSGPRWLVDQVCMATYG